MTYILELQHSKQSIQQNTEKFPVQVNNEGIIKTIFHIS